MQPQRILRASLSVLLAASGVSAQGVVSQLGGFLERAQDIPVSPPNALSLFLQQDQPSFQVAPPQAPTSVAAAALAMQVVAAPPAPAVAGAPAPAVAGLPGAVVMQTMAKPKGLLSLRSMRVSNPGPEGSKIFFGSNSEFSMGTDSAGNFVVQQASAASPLLSLDSQDTLHLGSTRVEALSLNAVNGISVRGVKQWQLLYSDDFSAPVAGWGKSDVTECGGVFMLGGFCKFSTGEVNKTFTGLPPHKQLRVRATYHFIDRWIGETGYMKLDVGPNGCSVPVWSEQHSQQDGPKGISLCGSPNVGEGKFSEPIEVTVPHHGSSVTVTFGSTIGGSDPCDESWGVSSVEVYVRD